MFIGSYPFFGSESLSIALKLEIKTVKIDSLIEYARNPRKNDDVVDKMVSCINEFGFRIPIVAKSDGTVIDGHLNPNNGLGDRRERGRRFSRFDLVSDEGRNDVYKHINKRSMLRMLEHEFVLQIIEHGFD